MKTYPSCIPCFFQQAINISRFESIEEDVLKEIMKEIAEVIKEITFEEVPAEIGRSVYKIIHKHTGNSDPYKKLKKESIDIAIKLLPQLYKELEASIDPLEAAIKFAIAGNVIDFGTGQKFNIIEEIEKIKKRDFAIWDLEEFKKDVSSTDSVLYIGDNAGESVFDRLLIQQLNRPVKFVVRDVPIINDVTYQEAVDSGLDKVSEIISSGVDSPGTILKFCSEEFKDLFYKSKLIISKGQGNFEGLSNESGNIYFMLKAKCGCIAERLGVSKGDLVLKKHSK